MIRPILFNTEMVTATLDNRKTATRRLLKLPRHIKKQEDGLYTLFAEGTCYENQHLEEIVKYIKPPYQQGDILYVRETWAFMNCINCDGDYRRPENDPPCYDTQAVEYDDGDSISDGCFIYRAGCRTPERITWRPSIHMPKEAARIWLKVTDVKPERLKNMTLDDFLNEGIAIPYEAFNDPDNAYMQAKRLFTDVWNSTVNKKQRDLYEWNANPWVWAIKFERIEKPEE